MTGFVDADWGSCVGDRHSYHGHQFLLNRGSIPWDYRKQREREREIIGNREPVAKSTTEASYMTLSEHTKKRYICSGLLGNWALSVLDI